MENSNKRIAKNTILLSIRMIFTMFVSLYTTRIVLNVLGVSDYGIYNVVCGFVSMFVFLTTSLANGIQRFYNFEYGKNGIQGAQKVFMASCMIQVLLIVLFVVMAESFGLWYLENKMTIPCDRMIAAKWVYQLSLLTFVFNILQVPFTAAVMAHEKMDFYAFVTVGDSILKLIMIVFLPYVNFDHLIIYGMLLLLVSIIDFTLYSFYCNSRFKEVSVTSIDFVLLKNMLTFSGWNMFGAFANMLKEQGVNVVLNLFFTPVVNAARGISFQVTASLRALSENLAIAVKPQLVQSYASGDLQRSYSLLFSLSKMTAFVFLFISYPILLEIDIILKIWLGEAIPEQTNIFTQLVFVVSFIGCLNSSLSSIVHASGKMKLYQLVTGSSTILVVPASYLWLRAGGSAVGVFYLCILFAIIMQYASLLVISHILPFSISNYVKIVMYPLIKVFIFGSILPFIPYCILNSGLFRLIIVCCLSFMSYSIVIYFIGLNSAERLLVNSFINNRIKK